MIASITKLLVTVSLTLAVAESTPEANPKSTPEPTPAAISGPRSQAGDSRIMPIQGAQPAQHTPDSGWRSLAIM